MKVYTAVEDVPYAEGDVWCFLAGGITNCWDWQDAVIEQLANKDETDHLVILNPRRKNFPIDNPNAAREQIEWEFEKLNDCDIFSMYFTAGESTQPICMYELGRHLSRLTDSPFGPKFAVVSVEDGYVRSQDVEIQTELALGISQSLNLNATVEKHADDIYQAYQIIASREQ